MKTAKIDEGDFRIQFFQKDDERGKTKAIANQTYEYSRLHFNEQLFFYENTFLPPINLHLQ